MSGILHIFRVGEVRDRYQQAVPEFQVNYDPGDGNSYARTLTGRERLAEFLAASAHVPQPDVDNALEALDTAGHVTLPDVEIPEHEAAAIGLEELPSDF